VKDELSPFCRIVVSEQQAEEQVLETDPMQNEDKPSFR
jgi:hypothetical protein